MTKYGVIINFVNSAYVEVEADNVEEAEDKAYDLAMSGEAEPYGSSDDTYNFEVEEL